MPFIEQFAQQQAGNIANQGMGLLFQGLANRQNLRQARRMQNLQIEGSKEMTDYNRKSQFQMWLDTNFPAQVEQLQKAGLNPALIYEGSGAGATTGSGGGGMPSGGVQKSAEPIGMQVLTTAQLRLLDAQTKNIEADTEQKKGVQTQEAEGRIALLAQQTKNEKAKRVILEADGQIRNFEKNVAEKGMDFAIRQIEASAKSTEEQLESLQRNNEIGNATKDDTIKQIKQEAIGVIIKNKLGVAQEQATKASTALMEAQRQAVIQGRELTAAQIFDTLKSAGLKMALRDKTSHDKEIDWEKVRQGDEQLDQNEERTLMELSNPIQNILKQPTQIHNTTNNSRTVIRN